MAAERGNGAYREVNKIKGRVCEEPLSGKPWKKPAYE